MSIATRIRQSITLLDNLANEALVAALVATSLHSGLRKKEGYSVADAIREVNERRGQLEIEVCRGAGRQHDLYLAWTVEQLVECLELTGQIDIEKVAELLKQRQQTQAIFQQILSKVTNEIDRPTAGVLACYQEVVKNPSKYDVRVIELMGRVHSNAKSIKRVISWLQRPLVRWLVFELRPLYAVIAAACVFVCIYFWTTFHSTAFIAPETIMERVASDGSRVADIWQERDAGPFSKLADTAELLYHLASATPFVLLISSVPLYFVRRFVIKSASRRSKLEALQTHLINTARQLGINGSRVEVIMGPKIDISGGGINIVNVAEYIQGVNNQVSENLIKSSSNDTVKKLVRQLTNEISEIAGQVDPALAQKMGKNAKKLSEEMAESQPDRKWYELSLDGLKEAAEAVGAIATPIITTVGKLRPLLLGL